jgi:hypothetical protein
VENALYGPIKQLNRTISEMDKNREKFEDSPRHITQQEDALPKTDKDERVEETLHGKSRILRNRTTYLNKQVRNNMNP